MRRFEPRNRPVLPNTDDSPSKDVWLRWGWPKNLIEPEQLYDLVFDPQERRNLAGDLRYADALADVRALLERWMHDTDDPLLRGPIPAPEGAIVSPPELVSPRDSR